MNSSVALTTSGSAFARGNPVAFGELANLMISVAGRRARDARVWTVAGAMAGTMADAMAGVPGTSGVAAAEAPLRLIADV